MSEGTILQHVHTNNKMKQVSMFDTYVILPSSMADPRLAPCTARKIRANTKRKAERPATVRFSRFSFFDAACASLTAPLDYAWQWLRQG